MDKLVMWEDAKRKIREADKSKLLAVSVNSKSHAYAWEMGWRTHHMDGHIDWMIHRSQVGDTIVKDEVDATPIAYHAMCDPDNPQPETGTPK